MPYDPERHGPHRVVGPGFREKVYAAVARVPAGRVTTYGEIAAGLGLRSVARQVGFALAALPPDRVDVPWHRVINSQGRVSHGDPGRRSEQIQLLAEEGVAVDDSGRVSGFRTVLFSYGEDAETGTAPKPSPRRSR